MAALLSITASLWPLAVTESWSLGITPTREKRDPDGFQHLEHPQKWLWETLLERVISTGELELELGQRQCSVPPGKDSEGEPLVRPLSISGCREGGMVAVMVILALLLVSLG
jgi:hypothetical protein